MNIHLSAPRPIRRPSLTPMIDVVFLLLVFFMLAARFGGEGIVELGGAGGADDPLAGPPRLVDILPEGQTLNGVPVEIDALPTALDSLGVAADAVIVLRPRAGAATQRLVDVMQMLSSAGFTSLAVVEGQ